MTRRIAWPAEKTFAFTITDDTDNQTLADGPNVYAFLRDIGLRTTKLLWPVASPKTPTVGGLTCDDPAYRAWCLQLVSEGFEPGLHNVTYTSSERDEVRRGLGRFTEIFGHPATIFANHVGCAENIYWNEYRLTGLRRRLYGMFRRINNKRPAVFGQIEDSPYFWGDLCRDTIRYVRWLTFHEINAFRVTDAPLFTDPNTPFVRTWFIGSEGADAEQFANLISERQQDRLEEEGGMCIVYTHLASGFYRDQQIHPRWRRLMERLARKNGWFAPASEILDHVASAAGIPNITSQERRRIEHRWIWEKLRSRLNR